MNRAANGSSVLVAAGIYTYSPENDNCAALGIPGGSAVVCFVNKEIAILGGYTVSNWLQANPALNPTIIDGQNARRGVRVQRTTPWAPVASLRLEGFAVRNGLAQGGDAGSAKGAFGGGLLAENSGLQVRDTVFADNTVRGGSTGEEAGGTGAGGGVAFNADADHPGVVGRMERVQFERNHAVGGVGSQRGGEGLGGGLFTYGVTLDGDKVDLLDNTASGALSAGHGNSAGQRSDALGGAAAFMQRSTVRLQRSLAAGNVGTGGDAPVGDGGGAWGGAIFVEGASLSLTNAEVRENIAQDGAGHNALNNGSSIAQGGGLASLEGWSGGTAVAASIALDRVAFVRNAVRGGSGTVYSGAAGGGGAALIASSGAHRVTNSLFAENTVEMSDSGAWVGGGGGGLWLQGVTARVEHSTFARNTLSARMQSFGAQGFGIILATPWPTSWPTVVDLDFPIIADHTSTKTAPNHPLGLSALQVNPGTVITLNRGLYAGNTLNDNSVADAPEWRGSYSGLGTMLQAAAAGFLSPGSPNSNYHLRMTSPARDQATGSSTQTDLDGDARSVPDIGADEWVPFPLTAAAGDRRLDLSWFPNAGLGTIVGRYEVVVACSPGAAAPREGACNTPIGVGSRTEFSLTGLTNGKTYTVKVSAKSASGEALSESPATPAAPWIPASLVFLPTLRNY